MQSALKGQAVHSVAPDALASRFPPLRILLVEDNEMNQAVATRILTRESHTVVIANNGQEAVERSQRERFDIILMDITMPVMDGYTAARRIREIERQTGVRVPIIAMTARTMAGDRELCLEAGMDEHVSKPIDREHLLRLLAEFVPSPGSVAPARPDSASEGGSRGQPSSPPGAGAAIDANALLKRLYGNMEHLAEDAGLFLQLYPKHMTAIRGAIEGRDCEALYQSAHTLKSMFGNLSAQPASNEAAALERMGREGRLERAAESFARLEQEVEKVIEALRVLTGARKP